MCTTQVCHSDRVRQALQIVATRDQGVGEPPVAELGEHHHPPLSAFTAGRAGPQPEDVSLAFEIDGDGHLHGTVGDPHRGIGVAVGAMCPIVPNALWAMDFQFDTTVDGRTIKLLNVVDEYTRECPAIVVGRFMNAGRVVATLDVMATQRGAPAFLRSDTARSSSLRPSPTGAGSTVSDRSSSIPARHGRRLSWDAGR